MSKIWFALCFLLCVFASISTQIVSAQTYSNSKCTNNQANFCNYISECTPSCATGNTCAKSCNCPSLFVKECSLQCWTCPDGYMGCECPSKIDNYCTVPTRSNGVVTGTAKNQIGDVATLACNTGYSIAASSAASDTCAPSRRNYDNLGTCVLTDPYCPNPTAASSGSITLLTNRKLGGEVTYQCNNGFSPTAPSTATCNINAQWSFAAPACTPISGYCPQVANPTDATVSYGNNRVIQSSITYTCHFGYYVSGTDPLAQTAVGTCTAGTVNAGVWSISPITCTPRNGYCSPVLPPLHGELSYSIAPPIMLGTQAHWTCNLGYQFASQGSTSRVSTCSAGSITSGEWTPVSSVEDCSPIPNFCTTLEERTGGAISCDGPNDLTTTCVLTCFPGYALVGNHQTECTLKSLEGSWLPLGNCEPCQPGYSCPDGTAAAECPAAFFQDQSAQSSCLVCPTYSSSNSGATVCNCDPNYEPLHEEYTPRTLVCTPLGTLTVAENSRVFHVMEGNVVTVHIFSNAPDECSADISLKEEDSTAESDDFSLSNSTLEFEGAGVKSFTVTILEDGKDEQSEVLTLELTNFKGTTGSDYITVTIYIDANSAQNGVFRLHPNDISTTEHHRFDESVGNVAVLVRREISGNVEETNAEEAVVTLYSTEFPDAVFNVYFAEGEIEKQFLYPIIDDDIPELDQTIALTITHVSTGFISHFNTYTFIINANDDPHGVFTFEFSQHSIVEGNITDPATVTTFVRIVRERGLFGEASVRVSSKAGSAISGSDYTPISYIAAFAEGQTYVTVSVVVINDDIPEINELFSLELTSPVTGGARINPTSFHSNFIILENDDARGVISFDTESVERSVSEDIGVVLLTVKRSRGVFGSISFSVTTVGVTAMPDLDFVSKRDVETMGPNVDTKIIPIVILDDNIPELDEVFKVQLSDFLFGVTGGSALESTITILKNDVPHGYFAFEFIYSLASPFSVQAGDSVELKIVRSAGLFGDVYLSLALISQDPHTPINAFITPSPPTPIHFESDESFKWVTLNVPFEETGNQEQILGLTIQLSTDHVNEHIPELSTDTSYYLIPEQAESVGVIFIPIAHQSVRVEESDGFVEIPIRRMPGSDSEYTVLYRASSGTAQGNDIDFTNANDYEVVFEPDSDFATIRINITDDGLPELDEWFSITLLDSVPHHHSRDAGVTSYAVSLVAKTAIVTIAENNDPYGIVQIGTTETSMRISETIGILKVNLKRLRGLNGATSVTATVRPASAEEIAAAALLDSDKEFFIPAIPAITYDISQSLLTGTFANNVDSAELSIRIVADAEFRSGVYRVFVISLVTSTNGMLISDSRSSVLVAVKDAAEDSFGSGGLPIAGAVGGTIGAVILLIVAVLIINRLRKRKRNKRGDQVHASESHIQLTGMRNGSTAANSDILISSNPMSSVFDGDLYAVARPSFTGQAGYDARDTYSAPDDSVKKSFYEAPADSREDYSTPDAARKTFASSSTSTDYYSIAAFSTADSSSENAYAAPVSASSDELYNVPSDDLRASQIAALYAKPKKPIPQSAQDDLYALPSTNQSEGASAPPRPIYAKPNKPSSSQTEIEASPHVRDLYAKPIKKQ